MTAKTIVITRRVEFDAGHRVPDCNSVCRNLHGHRYVLEVSITGEVRNQVGDPENGMITDFGALKEILHREIASKWDHAFLVYKKDQKVADFLATMPEHKTVMLDVVPTAENLVALAAKLLANALRTQYAEKVTLTSVRLYETPNCWADAII